MSKNWIVDLEDGKMIDAPSEETHEFGSDHGETAIPLISKGLFGDPVQGCISRTVPAIQTYTALYALIWLKKTCCLVDSVDSSV